MDAEVSKKAFVIEWRQGFEINIPQIDEEHKRLFSIVKALALETADQTIEELLGYVVTHFSHEQDMMERSNYPGFEQHLRLHEEFASQVADFLGSGEPWSEERIQALRRFLNKWLIGHIMTHDLRFGNWYAAHNGANSNTVLPGSSGEAARPQAHAESQQKSFFKRLFKFGGK